MKSMIEWFTNEATGPQFVIATAAIIIIAAFVVKAVIDIIKSDD